MWAPSGFQGLWSHLGFGGSSPYPDQLVVSICIPQSCLLQKKLMSDYTHPPCLRLGGERKREEERERREGEREKGAKKEGERGRERERKKKREEEKEKERKGEEYREGRTDGWREGEKREEREPFFSHLGPQPVVWYPHLVKFHPPQVTDPHFHHL